MLAASVDPGLIVVLVVAALLALVAAVALRRRASRASVASMQAGTPVAPTHTDAAPPETDLTLPPDGRPDGSAPHVAPVTVAPTTAEPVAAPEDMWERTHRTRSLFGDAFRRIRSRTAVGPDTWDELEETLLLADLGVRLTDSLLAPLKERVKAGELRSPGEVVDALRASMTASLSTADRSLNHRPAEMPAVWLFVGVNGVGKTTTIGKVGSAQTALGRRVLMAAGDTFRAAAAEQLETWAQRCGADFVRGGEGADPASVIFDGIQAGAARGAELVLADTAGRLHTKSNLMEELGKVRRVADKAPGTVCEVLLVIDATTGQNGLTQAREFAAATDVTGVVLTKLDGSAKGGIVFAIETELGIPVKLAGLGETAADLAPFDPEKYVSAILG
ncbi:MAG: signal recognition particle-docking protein FtsY [Ilumatobacteraceae bacterium]